MAHGGSSRVAYKTLPQPKWLLATRKFTLILSNPNLPSGLFHFTTLPLLPNPDPTDTSDTSDTSLAAYCACSVSMVWNWMGWTMYVARWSSRVAYKTLPESKWLLAAFKFTLILSNPNNIGDMNSH